jgi:peroxiredoxin
MLLSLAAAGADRGIAVNDRLLNSIAWARSTAAGLTPDLLVRWTIAGVLLAAASTKLFDLPTFTTTLLKLHWIPGPLAGLAALVVVAAEIAVGLSLLTGCFLAAGAAGGAALGIAFTALTSRLIASGVASSCPCFGVLLKLPPALTLALDLALTGGSLYLLARARGTGGRPWREELRKWRASPIAVRAAAAAVYALVMTGALGAGFAREARRVSHDDVRQVTLRYGDPAPPVRLLTSTGAWWDAGSFRGKWTLVMFLQDMCGPCEQELADVARSYPGWEGRIQVLVVLGGRPLLGSARAAAGGLARRLGFPAAVAVDPDRKAARAYCDLPLRSPFSLLVDPQGRVRFAQDGRESGKFSLVTDIQDFLADRPYGAETALRRGMTYGRRMPDGTAVVDGREVRLSDLWSRRPLLLSFLLVDCPACREHVTQVERFLGSGSALSVLHVFPTREQAQQCVRSRRPRGAAGADVSGGLHTAYQVWRAPSTFLIYRGRLLYASDPRSDDRELERLLRDSGSLPDPRSPVAGSQELTRR